MANLLIVAQGHGFNGITIGITIMTMDAGKREKVTEWVDSHNAMTRNRHDDPRPVEILLQGEAPFSCPDPFTVMDTGTTGAIERKLLSELKEI